MQKDPFAIPLETKVGILTEATQEMGKVKGLHLARGAMDLLRQTSWFLSSEGSDIEQTVTHTSGGIEATAVAGADVQTSFLSVVHARSHRGSRLRTRGGHRPAGQCPAHRRGGRSAPVGPRMSRRGHDARHRRQSGDAAGARVGRTPDRVGSRARDGSRIRRNLVRRHPRRGLAAVRLRHRQHHVGRDGPRRARDVRATTTKASRRSASTSSRTGSSPASRARGRPRPLRVRIGPTERCAPRDGRTSPSSG